MRIDSDSRNGEFSLLESGKERSPFLCIHLLFTLFQKPVVFFYTSTVKEEDDAFKYFKTIGKFSFWISKCNVRLFYSNCFDVLKPLENPPE
jgi:hypothetical protein